jgi:hypothetical protein
MLPPNDLPVLPRPRSCPTQTRLCAPSPAPQPSPACGSGPSRMPAATTSTTAPLPPRPTPTPWPPLAPATRPWPLLPPGWTRRRASAGGCLGALPLAGWSICRLPAGGHGRARQGLAAGRARRRRPLHHTSAPTAAAAAAAIAHVHPRRPARRVAQVYDCRQVARPQDLRRRRRHLHPSHRQLQHRQRDLPHRPHWHVRLCDGEGPGCTAGRLLSHRCSRGCC